MRARLKWTASSDAADLVMARSALWPSGHTTLVDVEPGVVSNSNSSPETY